MGFNDKKNQSSQKERNGKSIHLPEVYKQQAAILLHLWSTCLPEMLFNVVHYENMLHISLPRSHWQSALHAETHAQSVLCNSVTYSLSSEILPSGQKDDICNIHVAKSK